MIRNIVFDMGGVLLHYDPARFVELLQVSEEDRALLMREVFQTVAWFRMDRGTIEEEEAAKVMKGNLPPRLHGEVDRLGLVGNWWALILPAVFSPFGVFLLRQVFDTCSGELLEAARLDGAGDLRILFGILVPRCRAGVVSLVILSFIDAWNMVEQPLVYLKSEYDYPLSIFLSRLNGQNVGLLCTCGVLAALPVVLLFLYYDQELTEGVTLSQL